MLQQFALKVHGRLQKIEGQETLQLAARHIELDFLRFYFCSAEELMKYVKENMDPVEKVEKADSLQGDLYSPIG